MIKEVKIRDLKSREKGREPRNASGHWKLAKNKGTASSLGLFIRNVVLPAP